MLYQVICRSATFTIVIITLLMQEDGVVEVPAARPARARAAVKKTYVEISDSDKSDSAPEEEGSEFEVSE